MSNFMKSARSWLGLGNDPYYEDEYGDPATTTTSTRTTATPDGPRSLGRRPARAAAPPLVVRRSFARAGSDWEENDGGVRVISSSAPTPGPNPSPEASFVRCPSAAKPHVVSPIDLQRRPAGGRLVQAVPAGDRQPPGRRPRPVPAAHRFRERTLLRPRGQHGTGGGPRVPAHAVRSADLRRRSSAAPRAAVSSARKLNGETNSWQIICGR